MICPVIAHILTGSKVYPGGRLFFKSTVSRPYTIVKKCVRQS